MQKFEIKDHEPSYLPSGNWKLAWSDEFDGTELDTTKWSFRKYFWGNEFPAFTDKGIVLDGKSHMEMHRVPNGDYYVSPQLQTADNSFDIPKEGGLDTWNHPSFWPLGKLEKPKFVHTYGYYECRCKFQNDPETMWSAFWTQSPTIGARFEPEWCGVESDIMECFNAGKATTGNIMNGYGKQLCEDGRVKYDLKETADGWHYFGMNWQPEGYTFYCDGEIVSQCSEHVSHVPQFILLTTEIMGYRPGVSSKLKKIEGEPVDDAFIVDFVRVYDLKK